MGLHNESVKAELILSNNPLQSKIFVIASPVSCLNKLNIWLIKIYKYTLITLFTEKRYQNSCLEKQFFIALCQIADRNSNLAKNRIFITLTQLWFLNLDGCRDASVTKATPGRVYVIGMIRLDSIIHAFNNKNCAVSTKSSSPRQSCIELGRHLWGRITSGCWGWARVPIRTQHFWHFVNEIVKLSTCIDSDKTDSSKECAAMHQTGFFWSIWPLRDPRFNDLANLDASFAW